LINHVIQRRVWHFGEYCEALRIKEEQEVTQPYTANSLGVSLRERGGFSLQEQNEIIGKAGPVEVAPLVRRETIEGVEPTVQDPGNGKKRPEVR